MAATAPPTVTGLTTARDRCVRSYMSPSTVARVDRFARDHDLSQSAAVRVLLHRGLHDLGYDSAETEVPDDGT